MFLAEAVTNGQSSKINEVTNEVILYDEVGSLFELYLNLTLQS